ncbi:MAG: bifunctional diguanylate cyclase/phosphodiesterase [Steroidobacteraceae bacterium]|nr:bifunctional diguanylate cyclase/phosphodiesterase [Steroidobacteraceae bacterium]
MPVESHATALLDVLRASRPHVGCTALALLAPGPRLSLCWADSPDDRAFAEEQLRHLGEQLFREAASRREGFVQNKIRLSPGGPLVCRVLAVPFVDGSGTLAGLLVGISRPEAEPLDERALRRASRVAIVIGPTFVGETDALTGLLAYSAFDRQARGALLEAASAHPACVLYGDIDQLHVVNDRFGFGAGDRAIAHVGASIQQSMDGVRGIAARLSGDRFTVLLLGCTLPQARAVADRIRECVAHRDDSGADRRVPVTISWGAAPLARERQDLQHALAAAELACKAAKDRGRNRVEVYQEADQSIIRRREDVFMIGSLRDALDDGRLRVFAQPIVPLADPDARPVAYELLARMEDKDGRVVEPAAFMSAAIRYQLLPLIDRAVVIEAFSLLDVHRGHVSDAGLRFSINLSGPTLCDAGFLEWLLEQMSAMAIDGQWLSFEVTESAAAADLGRPQDLIRRLKSRGCRFALDDFGTGVNSLAYLKALDVDVIKLDGSYVRDMIDNPRSEALVKAVTALAGSMGISTVAEYVESRAILERLRELGVMFGQGYALGRPQPLETLFGNAEALEPAA